MGHGHTLSFLQDLISNKQYTTLLSWLPPRNLEMPKQAGTQFLPFLELLLEDQIIKFEEVILTDAESPMKRSRITNDTSTPIRLYAIVFDCSKEGFINLAKNRGISSKETSFLKNLSNYGFKRYDKNGNVKRYYSKYYQPGYVDKYQLIEKCKKANEIQNSKKKVQLGEKRSKHASGDSGISTNQSQKQFKLETDSTTAMAIVRPNSIFTNSSSSIFRSREAAGLRCVQRVNSNSYKSEQVRNTPLYAETVDMSIPEVALEVKNSTNVQIHEHEYTRLINDNVAKENRIRDLENQLKTEKSKNFELQKENERLKSSNQGKVSIIPADNIPIPYEENIENSADPVPLFSTMDSYQWQ